MILSNFKHKILAENQLHQVFLVNITFRCIVLPKPKPKQKQKTLFAQTVAWWFWGPSVHVRMRALPSNGRSCQNKIQGKKKKKHVWNSLFSWCLVFFAIPAIFSVRGTRPEERGLGILEAKSLLSSPPRAHAASETNYIFSWGLSLDTVHVGREDCVHRFLAGPEGESASWLFRLQKV